MSKKVSVSQTEPQSKMMCETDVLRAFFVARAGGKFVSAEEARVATARMLDRKRREHGL